jgi:hypothetical protein
VPRRTSVAQADRSELPGLGRARRWCGPASPVACSAGFYPVSIGGPSPRDATTPLHASSRTAVTRPCAPPEGTGARRRRRVGSMRLAGAWTRRVESPRKEERVVGGASA